MDLDAVAQGLEQNLETIIGLRAFSEVPTKINPPAAIIGLGSGGYDDNFDHIGVNFGVLVLLSSSNAATAQQALRAYTAATGPSSIKQACETSLGIGVDVMVNGWDAPAVITIGGIDYLGVEFHLRVVE